VGIVFSIYINHLYFSIILVDMDDEEENSSEAFKDGDVVARGSMIPAL
jgi:hypothetical protein